MKKLILFSIIMLLYISTSTAIEYPRIEPYVNDFADILTTEEERQLNLYLDALEQNTTVEIAVVSVKDTQGMDRVEYANHIGDVNGVGKKDSDNGVVILWSLDNQKGGAIAVGRGIESILNDAKVSRIGRESRPYFDSEDYDQAYMFIILQIEREIKTDSVVVPMDAPKKDSTDLFPFLFFLIPFGFIILKILSLFFDDYDDSSSSKPSKSRKSGRSRRTYSSQTAATMTALGGVGAGYSSGGSSSSSSGSRGVSFGGGGFGGGGGGF